MDKEMETAAASGEELTLEESFARLDELAARLEERDIPLEEAFSLYREGMELIFKQLLSVLEKNKVAEIEALESPSIHGPTKRS